MAFSLAHAGVLNLQALAFSPASCTTSQNAVRSSTGVAPAFMKQRAPFMFNSRRRCASIVAAADGNSSYRDLETVSAGSTEEISEEVLGGEIFRPMQDLQESGILDLVDQRGNDTSLARQRYSPDTETAINDSINVAYTLSYAFHSMAAFFDRDNIALQNVAKYFYDRSKYELDDALKLTDYQNRRGGRVQLLPLQAPFSEFDDPEKGDALNTFELALGLEKIQNEKYLALQAAIAEVGDPQADDYVKSTYLHPQIEKLKRTAEQVRQLRRVGKGYGVWHFDQELEGGEEIPEPVA
ncbi:Ferritin [Klebsormidium nitens]|uniref:Ferritin n=1 Tax=Klebsormidium nitens TaxID=105231 RepID=A0A1Y1HTC2_KLENI|nr:Ferritin [Klebsormidium nitens]|eukprot:GAQ81875.1 Ferritin [Klebsormidium nitens]